MEVIDEPPPLADLRRGVARRERDATGSGDAGFLNAGFLFRHSMVLRKLKRLLGLGSSQSSSRGNRRDVTFDEDRDNREESADSSEESSTPTTSATEAADEASESDAAAAGTDASASTGSLVDEAESADESTAAAEPAEATGPESGDVTTDPDEVEPETADGDVTADDASSVGADGMTVDEVKGIGPAYSDRLAEADVHTAEDLAEADAEALSERITVPEKTVQKWIDRARER